MIVVMYFKYLIVLILHCLNLILGQNDELTISKEQNTNVSALTENDINSAVFESTSVIFVNTASNRKHLDKTPIWQMVLDYR